MGKKRKKQIKPDIAPVKRTYEAAQTTRFRRQPTFSQSGDAAVDLEGGRLRAWARYLDENLDIAKGVLDTLTNAIVGCGVTPEPMVMQKNGKPAKRINDQIRMAWEEWSESPEVTGEYSMMETERKVCRSWLRDGECLVQLIAGNVAGLRHLGGIPFSLELIESDYLPYDLMDTKEGVVHGVRKNAWGRPVAYYLYKQHPGNTGSRIYPRISDTKEVPADRMLHVKLTERIKQTRGVTALHSVITRLDDVKDFEESERVKARVQAAFCAAIVKSADTSVIQDDTGDRTFSMDPGMIFDGLMPGEDIRSIESTSPTEKLKDYRAEMLRAVAAGTETNYSSISKDYNGTYSAQRQELVESMPSYRRMRENFIAMFTRPVYRTFIDMAVASGKISAPRTMDRRDLYAVDFGNVIMPWIDPQKEAAAFELLLANKIESREAIIRARGGDPKIVDEQIKSDQFRQEMESQTDMPSGRADENQTSNEDESEVDAA